MVAVRERPNRAARRHPVVGPLKLDLGCGQNKRDGFLGVDIVLMPGIDVVHDLTVTPWPWKNESVGEVFSSHFLEHLDGPERVRVMDELWRVLVPGAQALIIVPYYSSMRASQDPYHKWPPLSEASFLYFNREWRKANKLDHYPIHCDFDFSYGYGLAGDWGSRAQEARDFAVQHYINVVADLHVTMVKRTAPANPGHLRDA